MKISNTILWGTFVGIFVICVIFLIIVRHSLVDSMSHSGVSIQKNDIRRKEITMTNFTGVDLKGNWQARIIQGDKEKIWVEGPEDLLAIFSVTRQGNSIEIHMAKQINDKRKLHLEMTIPVLKALQTKGVADIEVSGFKLDDLRIHTDGVSSIRGEKGQLGKLNFRGKGVFNLDLQDFPTKSADLNCEGVIKIYLTMTGGELTGRLKGVGEVRYKGEINYESIHTKGSCKVTRR